MGSSKLIYFTGSSGYVGEELVKRFKKNNWNLVQIKSRDFFNNKQLFNDSSNLLLHFGEPAMALDNIILDIENFSSIVFNYSKVFQKIIYISSINVKNFLKSKEGGEIYTLSPYTCRKIICERIILQNPNNLIVRLPGIIKSNPKKNTILYEIIEQLKKGVEEPILKNQDSIVEIISVNDLYKILVDLIKADEFKALNSRIIDIHSPTPILAKELAEIMISKFKGNNIRLIKESLNLIKYKTHQNNSSEIFFADHDIFDLIDQINL